MTQNLYEQRKEQLLEYYRENKRLPSYSELAGVFGVKSTGSLYNYVEKFIEEGLVVKSDNGNLIPTPKLYGVRILGTIQAGFPTLAEEQVVDAVCLNDLLIHDPSSTYLLKVDGDSMKDVGVMRGDMVIVNRSVTPRAGDMVVAEIDHEWTLKFLMKKGSQLFLRAANKMYPDMYPREQLRFGGVVTGVVRKFI